MWSRECRAKPSPGRSDQNKRLAVALAAAQCPGKPEQPLPALGNPSSSPRRCPGRPRSKVSGGASLLPPRAAFCLYSFLFFFFFKIFFFLKEPESSTPPEQLRVAREASAAPARCVPPGRGERGEPRGAPGCGAGGARRGRSGARVPPGRSGQCERG